MALELSVLNILASLLWFVVLAWLIIIVLTLYGLSRQKTLSPIDDLRFQANDAPLVSVLVPARNEEHRVLANCIHSILDQDYGRLEIIAVNDRSTDATGAILEVLARADARLRVIEGQEPPAGWLGKAYAMHQAFNHARGEWILATDADMIFDKTALRTAVVNTLEREADAMTLIPYFEASSFWERVMIPTWAWALLMFTVLYRVNKPKSKGAVGIGGFFLMRRGTLEHAGGYEALKDEVLEDVRLAEMIKRSGGSLLTEYAPGLLSTRMYRNFGEMWECCTKNWFSGVKFSLPFAMWNVFSIYLSAVVPPLIALASAIGIATGASTNLWRLFVPAALSWMMQVFVLVTVGIRSEVHPAYALTAPLGLGVLYAMLIDSSIRITMGKGVRWKGRRVYENAGVRPPQLRTVASRFSRTKKKEEGMLSKRPLSVTIIGCMFVAAGVIGFAYHVTEFNPKRLFEFELVWACLLRLLAILGGVFVLRGNNWARWLLLVWIAYHVILSAFHSMSELVAHGVLFVVIAYVLFRPQASAYFRSAGAEPAQTP